MVRNTVKSRVRPSAALLAPKAIEKKKKVEKKQNNFFRRYIDGHPLDATQKLQSEHIDNDTSSVGFSLFSETSSDNTMRGIASLPMVLTENKEETMSSHKSTDNLLAGLFSPSDYQKNIDSPVTPVSSDSHCTIGPLITPIESLWSLGPLVTPTESCPVTPASSDSLVSIIPLISPAESWSLIAMTPTGLFCTCKNMTYTSEVSVRMSDEEDHLFPMPKDSLELAHAQRKVHFEEDSSSVEEEKSGKVAPRKRLTKKRQRKDLSDSDRITALEMEVHLLKEMLLAQSKTTSMDLSTQTEEKAVEEMINYVSEKSSIRQRVALFEAKSDTAVDMKNGEEVSKRQTHTV